ncbi:hypothetical protein [Streptomyces triculaminicus]|uniref:hypothetical protein n=1 Tax=Streptomyces triculaminicus TaxID=2816232 RepID=UPI00378D4E7D
MTTHARATTPTLPIGLAAHRGHLPQLVYTCKALICPALAGPGGRQRHQTIPL